MDRGKPERGVANFRKNAARVLDNFDDYEDETLEQAEAVMTLDIERERLERRIKDLQLSLTLVRMSVELIMAREGCSLELDNEAKLEALKKIDGALNEALG